MSKTLKRKYTRRIIKRTKRRNIKRKNIKHRNIKHKYSKRILTKRRNIKRKNIKRKQTKRRLTRRSKLQRAGAPKPPPPSGPPPPPSDSDDDKELEEAWRKGTTHQRRVRRAAEFELAQEAAPHGTHLAQNLRRQVEANRKLQERLKREQNQDAPGWGRWFLEGVNDLAFGQGTPISQLGRDYGAEAKDDGDSSEGEWAPSGYRAEGEWASSGDEEVVGARAGNSLVTPRDWQATDPQLDELRAQRAATRGPGAEETLHPLVKQRSAPPAPVRRLATTQPFRTPNTVVDEVVSEAVGGLDRDSGMRASVRSDQGDVSEEEQSFQLYFHDPSNGPQCEPLEPVEMTNAMCTAARFTGGSSEGNSRWGNYFTWDSAYKLKHLIEKLMGQGGKSGHLLVKGKWVHNEGDEERDSITFPGWRDKSGGRGVWVWEGPIPKLIPAQATDVMKDIGEWYKTLTAAFFTARFRIREGEEVVVPKHPTQTTPWNEGYTWGKGPTKFFANRDPPNDKLLKIDICLKLLQFLTDSKRSNTMHGLKDQMLTSFGASEDQGYEATVSEWAEEEEDYFNSLVAAQGMGGRLRAASAPGEGVEHSAPQAVSEDGGDQVAVEAVVAELSSPVHEETTLAEKLAKKDHYQLIEMVNRYGVGAAAGVAKASKDTLIDFIISEEKEHPGLEEWATGEGYLGN